MEWYAVEMSRADFVKYARGQAYSQSGFDIAAAMGTKIISGSQALLAGLIK